MENAKEDTQKTTPTEPTSSESTKIFVKRRTGDEYYFLPALRSSTKYSMSSKDWTKGLEALDEMMSKGNSSLSLQTEYIVF